MAIANVVSKAVCDLRSAAATCRDDTAWAPASIGAAINDNIRYMELNSGEQLDLDAIGTASVKIVQQATSNFEPVGRPKKVVMIIAFMSVFVAFSLAFIVDILDQSFKSLRKLSTAGYPVSWFYSSTQLQDPIFKDALGFHVHVL